MPAYELPTLPYAYNALEPFLSGELVELHWDKIHRGYVGALHTTMDTAGKAYLNQDFNTLAGLQRSFSYYLAAHLLHTLYWENLCTPGLGPPQPDGALANMINTTFGSFDEFQRSFFAASSTLLGGGFVVLSWEPVGARLLLEQVYDVDGSTGVGRFPLLVIDAWEHAYSLQYKNLQGDYLAGVWACINWTEVAARFEASHNVMCYRCGQELQAPGGLIFSPPDPTGNAVKYHLCANCFALVITP